MAELRLPPCGTGRKPTTVSMWSDEVALIIAIPLRGRNACMTPRVER